ncbi:MAG: lipoyl(octanoyl) transferase LipB [Clostridia bacterium]
MIVIRLGKLDYKKALTIQEELLALRQQNEIGDCLLLVEHPPVLTIGKSGKDANITTPKELLAQAGITIYDVGRGGDVTYHGPGQIVGYPIMHIQASGMGIKDYVWKVEEVFIRLLAEEYQITAHREEKKYTGVWVEDEKITAIGIAVKRHVTMHGFAFNVNTNLAHFGWINPCGIIDKGVTSLQKLLGKEMDFENMNNLVLKYFCQVFQVQPEFIQSKAEIMKLQEEELNFQDILCLLGLPEKV